MNRGRAILPGATLGVLGSGQLGRMFAVAARRMGYRVHVLSPEGPEGETPTGQIADREVVAAYDDLDAVEAFARGVDVVTFEFENVLSATAEACAKHAPVRPGGDVLHVTQNRDREKSFLKSAGVPVTPFVAVAEPQALPGAIEQVGTPAVLKTAAWGYDGKGQAIIRQPEDAEAAWAKLGGVPCVLEKFIRFEREVSIIAARGLDGSFAHFGPVDNTHANHILDVTLAPATVSDRVAAQAVEIARTVVEKLGVVGVLCVEFFVGEGDALMVNELAPRPHNSGHYTIDACVSDQFEQQVRAICGLPLGDARQHRPAAMANLLGDHWPPAPGSPSRGDNRGTVEPNWPAALVDPAVKLHLYGKRDVRPGRKMGHLTALADSAERAAEIVTDARAAVAGAR